MVGFNSFEPNFNFIVPDKMKLWELQLLLCHKHMDIRISLLYEH